MKPQQLQMLDQKSSNPDQIKGISRRSRKDDKGRNYECGCGKRYLSYPALYTHIKTKHEGQQPEGTKKTSPITNYRKNKQQIDEKILKELLTWTNEENYGIINELEDSKGKVSRKRRIREQIVGKQFYQTFSNLIKSLPINLYKKSSLDTVLSVYIFNAGEYVSQKLYGFYEKFAKLFKTCYSDHGNEIFDIFDKGHGENKLIRTFSAEQCRYTPLISDFFMRFFVPREESDLDEIAILERITYDFCSWMFQKKLTSMELIKEKKTAELNRDILQTKILKSQELNEESLEEQGISDESEQIQNIQEGS